MTMANQTTTNTAAPKTEPAAAPTFPTFPTFASFDPMAMWTTSQQTWTKLMTDAVGRAQSFSDQYVALEGQMMTRAHEAITTWAQLTHEALSYGVQLSTEARKIGFEAARKFSPAA
jgi:hypothetical protein